MTPRLPVTEDQWRIFRAKMEEIAEGNARMPDGVQVNPMHLAEMVLFLMDKIDHLEKRLSA
jgi:hypothetical protein